MGANMRDFPQRQQEVIDQLRAELDRLRSLVTEWADAHDQIANTNGAERSSFSAYADAIDALRKAVGR